MDRAKLPHRPMLADTADLDKVKYPVIVQPKFDGIRAIFWNGTAYSRSLKPFPNKAIQAFAESNEHLHGLDGEFIVGNPADEGVYNRTHRFVMTEDHMDLPADFKFFCYDMQDLTADYHTRILGISAALAQGMHHVSPVECAMVYTREELDRRVAMVINVGYEGVILRNPEGTYKAGRSTVKEGKLLKVKPWADMEGIIEGFEPWMENGNEAVLDERGLKKRSSHKDNKLALDKLGALVLRIDWKGESTTVNVGTGFTDEQRVWLWEHRERHLGEYVKFRYIPYGSLDRPRHPSYVGLRSTLDMGE